MGFFTNLWNGIKNVASNVWNGVKDTAVGVWNKVKPFVGAIPLVGNKIVSGVETVGNAINSGAKGVGHLASGNFSEAVKAGKDAYNGIKEGVNKLTNLKKGGMVKAQTVGGTHPYVMLDGQPHAVSFQR